VFLVSLAVWEQVIGGALALLSAAWVVLYPESLLDVVCALLWAYAEASALPPVFAAHKRSRLAPGENANPWVQNLVSSVRTTKLAVDAQSSSAVPPISPALLFIQPTPHAPRRLRVHLPFRASLSFDPSLRL